MSSFHVVLLTIAKRILRILVLNPESIHYYMDESNQNIVLNRVKREERLAKTRQDTVPNRRLMRGNNSKMIMYLQGKTILTHN